MTEVIIDKNPGNSTNLEMQQTLKEEEDVKLSLTKEIQIYWIAQSRTQHNPEAPS